MMLGFLVIRRVDTSNFGLCVASSKNAVVVVEVESAGAGDMRLWRI